MHSNLSIYFFGFCVHVLRNSLYPKVIRLFSSNSSKVLLFTFRYLIHIELIVVYTVAGSALILFFCVDN